MSVHRQKHHFPNLLKLIWLMVCTCFLLVSLALPVHSAHTAQMHPEITHHEKAHHENHLSEGFSAAHSQASAEVVNTSMAAHHVGHSTNPTCDEPDCDNMSDCNANCAMSTCCSSPGVSDTLPTQDLADLHRNTTYQLVEGPSVLSTGLEPLFRPPIL